MATIDGDKKRLSCSGEQIEQSVADIAAHKSDTTKHITAEERTAWNGNATSIAEIQTAVEGKVDKVQGKGLSANDYTDAEKQKLAGLDAALNQTAWNAAAIHDHSTGQLDIESGGWVKIGKIALVSIRFKVKANEAEGDDYKINAGAIFQGLPSAVTTMSGTGNSCVAVTNNLSMGITITDSGTMLLLTGQTIPANTRVYVSAAYLCQ